MIHVVIFVIINPQCSLINVNNQRIRSEVAFEQLMYAYYKGWMNDIWSLTWILSHGYISFLEDEQLPSTPGATQKLCSSHRAGKWRITEVMSDRADKGSTNFFLAVLPAPEKLGRRVPRALRTAFGVCGTGFLAFLSPADTRIQTWEQHGRNYFRILQHVDGAALEVFTVVGLQVAAETEGRGTGQRKKRRLSLVFAELLQVQRENHLCFTWQIVSQNKKVDL